MPAQNQHEFPPLKEVIVEIWCRMDAAAKRKFALSLALVIVSSVVVALTPVALKVVVDELGVGRDAALIYMLLGAYVLAQFVGRLLADLRAYVFSLVDTGLQRSLSEQSFAHVMSLPYRSHLDRSTGATNQTLSQGIQGMQSMLQHSISTFLPIGIELITMIVVFAGLNQIGFFFLFLATLLIYAFCFAVGAARISGAAREAAMQSIAANAVMVDGLINYEAIKNLGVERHVQGQYSSILGVVQDHWKRFHARAFANGTLASLTFALFLGSVLGYATYQIQAGAMTVGSFFLVNAYALQLLRPVEMAGIAVQHITQALANVTRMLELLKMPPERSTTSKPLPKGNGSLRFMDVCLSYAADRPILKNVSFELRAGTTLGVVGASGSGKTTLCRLVTRLLTPDSGTILLDGVPISEIDLTELRHAIAVVPQDAVLFNESLRFNIGCAREHATPDEIGNAARKAELLPLISSLKDGFDTVVGERGVKLSGGERQRVAIARAVLKKPRLYIFDEATSSLDSRTEQDIVRNLHEISKSVSTIIIAHRLSTLMHADQIIVLDQGEIIERGTHRELLALNGRYASLWLAQVQASANRQGAELTQQIEA